MTGKRVDFFAIDEHLHRRDRRQVGRERVDDCVDRQQLVHCAAWMRRRDVAAQIDECFAAVRDEQRSERRACRDRRHERLGHRSDLRRNDLPGLVDRAPLRVLEPANMAAVLVEMGYLTNAEQERLLLSDAFQSTFVQAIYDSVLRFRDSLAAAGTQ